VIDTFLRHIASATSLNSLNLAIIDAMNAMTPVEAVALTEIVYQDDWQFPGNLPEEKERAFTSVLRDTVGKSTRAMYKAGKPMPERYSRHTLTSGVRMFTGQGPLGHRTLVVSFPGNGGRLMMPLPIILQHLPANSVDLVIVPDRIKANYRKGIPKLGDTVEEALVKLKEHLPNGYQRVVTLGTSSGGVPSLLAAAELSADMVLAVGAGHPDDERWEETRNVSKRQLLEAAAPRLANCRVTLAFGAQSPDDEISAEAIAAIIPHARKVSMAVPGVEVKHAALFPVANAGQLRPFFREHLGLLK
jgi:hypothetical protein